MSNKVTTEVEQFNYFTGHKYQGVNAQDLARQGHKSNEWGTYHQWLGAGMQVQKGNHGVSIMIVKPDPEHDGKTLVKWYRVFNRDQVAPVEE